MKKALNIYFGFSLFLGASIYIAQQFFIPLPRIINHYVNDFLIIPIVLTTCLFLLRKIKNDKNYQIPFWIIVYLCIGFALFFEFYLPTYHNRYTSDIIDVILYFVSGFVYYYLQKNHS